MHAPPGVSSGADSDIVKLLRNPPTAKEPQ
jgi:hypothetical protein